MLLGYGSARHNVGPAELVVGIPPFLIGSVHGKDLAQRLGHFGHPAGVAVAATANQEQQGRQKSRQRGKNRGGRNQSGAGRKKRGEAKQDSTRPSVVCPFCPSSRLFCVLVGLRFSQRLID